MIVDDEPPLPSLGSSMADVGIRSTFGDLSCRLTSRRLPGEYRTVVGQPECGVDQVCRGLAG
jgi:hypothetical protein